MRFDWVIFLNLNRPGMKHVTLLLWLVFAFSDIFGQYLPETNIRTQINFNSDWKFILEDKAGFESPAFDDSNWRSLDLPHNWGI